MSLLLLLAEDSPAPNSYATLDAAAAAAPGRTFTASSKPSASQVAMFLEQTSAELDGILRARGYQVPVATTATSAWALLADYNARGAAAMVAQAAPGQDGKLNNALALWETAKKMLSDGTVSLDAPSDTVRGLPRHAGIATAVFSRSTFALSGPDFDV